MFDTIWSQDFACIIFTEYYLYYEANSGYFHSENFGNIEVGIRTWG